MLVSGTIGDHGMAVMIARGELAFEVDLEGDTAPVRELAAALLELGPEIRWLRDPTRGDLATALSELAQQANLAVALTETALPIRTSVADACEILGIDPLYLANEGRLVAVVAPDRGFRPPRDGVRGNASSTCSSATRCRGSANAFSNSAPTRRLLRARKR